MPCHALPCHAPYSTNQVSKIPSHPVLLQHHHHHFFFLWILVIFFRKVSPACQPLRQGPNNLIHHQLQAVPSMTSNFTRA
jgi:hypothetical protein